VTPAEAPREGAGKAGCEVRSGGLMNEDQREKNDAPERVPFMQRVLDNPFLLLFLGVVFPTVLYIIWGIMELIQIPVAP
jgi:hypothetical protein